MAVLATDDFNRTDGGLGANWSSESGFEILIVNSTIVQGVIEDTLCVAQHVGIAWPDDQYAQVVLTTIPSTLDYGPGPCARMQPASRNGYYVMCSTISVRILKRVAGTFTILGHSVAAPVAGQTCRLNVSGPLNDVDLEVFLNGVSVFTFNDTSSTHATGNTGMCTDGPLSQTESQADNFEGGDLAVAAGGELLTRLQYGLYASSGGRLG